MVDKPRPAKEPDLPKIQHYVPRLLLKNFCCGKRDHIFVLDKLKERTYRANITKVARERSFYDLETNEYILSLEPSLTSLESRTAEIIQGIIEREALVLSAHDRTIVSVFAAVQLLRGPGPREQILDAGRLLEAQLRQMGADSAVASGLGAVDEQGAKIVAMSLVGQPGQFAVHFLDKVWGLLRAPREQAFYISDSPVVMQNGRPENPIAGNLGLAVPGIEIYLPLTKALTLAFLCPSIYSELKEGLAGVPDHHATHLAGPRAFLAGLEDGTPIALRDEEAAWFNSLQVGNAARFVYASTEGFHVAKEMILKNPEFKTGPRMRVS